MTAHKQLLRKLCSLTEISKQSHMQALHALPRSWGCQAARGPDRPRPRHPALPARRQQRCRLCQAVTDEDPASTSAGVELAELG